MAKRMREPQKAAKDATARRRCRGVGVALKAAIALGRRTAGRFGGGRALRQALAQGETTLRELRESEARFRDVAEVAAELFWETDTNHRLVSITGDRRGLLDCDGMPLDPPLGRTRWEIAGVDPETDASWRAHKTDLDARCSFRQFRYSCRAAHGAQFHFAVSGKPIFDEAGRFAGYRGTSSIENEIIAAQARARRAETLLRDAVSSISEGFVIFDEDDRLFLCNEAYLSLYPLSASAMVPGARFEEILRGGLNTGRYPDAKGQEEEWLAERIRLHREPGPPRERLLSDGRWVLITERRMPNGGTAGLRIDITALKKIQASLHESQAQLNEAQRVSNTGSAVRDFSTGTIVWSDQLYRIFGIAREAGLPNFETIRSLIHPEDRERATSAIKAAVSGKDSPSLEYRIVRPDGTVRWVRREAKISLADDGSPLLLTSTYQDVTEQRLAERREAELETQLRHSQRLEALGTLAGGIAHDLNNTLVPILALSKLALRLLPPDSPVRNDMATVVAASGRARDLVRQILAFSRKQELDKREIDLRAVLGEALAMLRASLPATMRLVERLDAVPPIFGDAGQLQQVLVNLVTNAAHAIGGRPGTVTVTLAPLAAAPGAARPLLRLAVADTGCGIEAAHLERIFEPFFTTKSVNEGTGLGLALVHGIVTGHDGKIEVRSRPGEGSEFVILLPAAERLGAAPPAERAEPQDSAKAGRGSEAA